MTPAASESNEISVFSAKCFVSVSLTSLRYFKFFLNIAEIK